MKSKFTKIRKLKLKKYGDGGEKYNWSTIEATKPISVANPQRSGEQTIKTRFAEDEPLLIKPWENANRVAQGDMTKAATGQIEESISPADIVGGAKLIGMGIKGGINLAKNVYKINPLAFKANSKAYYRMIGEEGYEDALKSNIIKSKKPNAYPEPYFGKGKIPDGEYSNPKSTAFNPKTGERIPSVGYPGPYMVESKVPMKGVGAWADEIDPQIATPLDVNISNPGFKFYKQHWLKGYKELPKRKYGGKIKSKFLK